MGLLSACLLLDILITLPTALFLFQVSAKQTVDTSLPFLLIDVRSNYEYDSAHLILSINHPLSKLSRTVGWESSEMLAYKSHAHWIIIVYADDEVESSEAASLLVQRGYENIFMLSGGLNLIVDKLPNILVTKNDNRNFTPDLKLQIEMNIDSDILGNFLQKIFKHNFFKNYKNKNFVKYRISIGIKTIYS